MRQRIDRRRVWPSVVGILVLILAGTLAAPAFSGHDRPEAAELAATKRPVEVAASRGAARTPETVTTQLPTTTTAAPVTTTTTALTTTTAAPTTTNTAVSRSTNTQAGIASYYAQPWANKGCAHKTLPKGTTVTVTNVSTGKSVTCVVNDRGPYVAGRIIDLDTTIFKQLASTSAGVFRAQISW